MRVGRAHVELASRRVCGGRAHKVRAVGGMQGHRQCGRRVRDGERRGALDHRRRRRPPFVGVPRVRELRADERGLEDLRGVISIVEAVLPAPVADETGRVGERRLALELGARSIDPEVGAFMAFAETGISMRVSAFEVKKITLVCYSLYRFDVLVEVALLSEAVLAGTPRLSTVDESGNITFSD